MRIIVGLGNPGRTYAGSRHNIGFAVVEELTRRWRLALGRTRDGLRVADGLIAGETVMVVEPQLYMNLSGTALARLPRPVVAADMIVVHDDLDLEPGCVRVKRGGGTAGHRGLDSVVEHYGPHFTRVRVGIGRPCGQDAADYVLSPLEPDARTILDAAVARAADAIECILCQGAEVAMNRFNVRTSGAVIAAVATTGRN